MTTELVVVPCLRHPGRGRGEFYADSPYRGLIFGAAVVARGGTLRIVLTGMWGRPGDDTLRKLRRRNYDIYRFLWCIGEIFGTQQCSDGLCRM
jgi:IS5 family transposase